MGVWFIVSEGGFLWGVGVVLNCLVMWYMLSYRL